MNLRYRYKKALSEQRRNQKLEYTSLKLRFLNPEKQVQTRRKSSYTWGASKSSEKKMLVISSRVRGNQSMLSFGKAGKIKKGLSGPRLWQNILALSLFLLFTEGQRHLIFVLMLTCQSCLSEIIPWSPCQKSRSPQISKLPSGSSLRLIQPITCIILSKYSLNFKDNTFCQK